MKTGLFQSCGHCWVFQICWHIECNTFIASSFRIWNSSIGIPSPPLALFVVMLSKAHLTSHSRMSGNLKISSYQNNGQLFWIYIHIFFFSFYWTIIASQCCGLCHASIWINHDYIHTHTHTHTHTHIYICFLLSLPPSKICFYYNI